MESRCLEAVFPFLAVLPIDKIGLICKFWVTLLFKSSGPEAPYYFYNLRLVNSELVAAFGSLLLSGDKEDFLTVIGWFTGIEIGI
jgi:hypothetical protein